MKSWQVGLIILWAILSFLVLATLIVKRRQDKMRALYNATRWRMPYMPLGAGQVFYADTHIDNICRECQGVIDSRKIEYSAPGKLIYAGCPRPMADQHAAVILSRRLMPGERDA